MTFGNYLCNMSVTLQVYFVNDMFKDEFHLYTAVEAENKFGSKFFYRQKIYRLAERKVIPSFIKNKDQCFIGSDILKGFIKELELKIEGRFPMLEISKIQVFFDLVNGKRVVVDGLFGKSISINTDLETEEDLLLKLKTIIDWMESNTKPIRVEEIDQSLTQEETPIHEPQIMEETSKKVTKIPIEVLPEEIFWVKIDTGVIENIEVKSYILISLPSVAQFIGIRTDSFLEWITASTFRAYILSAHYKQFQDTGKHVPWKKGVVKGFTSFVPFELLPEIIIAFKQSGRNISYPEKADMLYKLATSTLTAVGLAISGNKDKAAQVLAQVGKGLGLSVADQIIGIFKQYESRDFQIQTNKEFFSKVKDMGLDYAVAAGTMTLGITGKRVYHWMTLGKVRKLPSKLRTSSREIMRQISPSDGVGMTFGEKHFSKDPNINEAISTGKQGKEFYERLKKVGLLDNEEK